MARRAWGLVAVLVFAACGGAGSGDTVADVERADAPVAPEELQPEADPKPDEPAPPPSDPPPPPDEPDTETDGPDPADVQIAEAAVWTLDDFPEGWTAARDQSDDDEDDPFEDQLEQCLGPEAVELAEEDHAEADSPEFTGPDDSELSVTVQIADDRGIAERVFAVFASPQAPPCVQEMFRAQAEAEPMEEGSFGDISVERVSWDALGDETTAMRVTVPLMVQGATIDLYMDLVIVRVDRGLVLTSALSIVQPYDPAHLSSLIDLSVGRLRSGLAA